MKNGSSHWNWGLEDVIKIPFRKIWIGHQEIVGTLAYFASLCHGVMDKFFQKIAGHFVTDLTCKTGHVG
tara:strand:- start:77 stop:283 length:207 start_codon:yes stop_codon:yes gene_type:complete